MNVVMEDYINRFRHIVATILGFVLTVYLMVGVVKEIKNVNENSTDRFLIIEKMLNKSNFSLIL